MGRYKINEFRLAPRGGDGLHPYLDEHGAWHGHRTALLERDGSGRLRPRPREELEEILSADYGARVDLGWRMASLEAVARALEAGDQILASLLLVHAELAPLPDAGASARIARMDTLRKF